MIFTKIIRGFISAEYRLWIYLPSENVMKIVTLFAESFVFLVSDTQ